MEKKDITIGHEKSRDQRYTEKYEYTIRYLKPHAIPENVARRQLSRLSGMQNPMWPPW